MAMDASLSRRTLLMRNRWVLTIITLRRAQACAITLAFLAVSALLTGCTVVTIHDSEGFTRVERAIGIAHITMAPTVSATVSKVRSFGFVSGPMGFQAGLSLQTIATASESCRVIVWVEAGEQLAERVWERIEQAKNVCVVDNREKKHASN
jgi:hypothetical protein